MRAREIHVEAEQLADEPLRWTSVKAALAAYAEGSEARFERIRRGCYRIRKIQISGKGHKAAITETVRSKVVPSVVVYVSAKLTAKTFCTMRNLRRARRVFMWRCGEAEKPNWPFLELLQAQVVLYRLSPAVVKGAP